MDALIAKIQKGLINKVFTTKWMTRRLVRMMENGIGRRLSTEEFDQLVTDMMNAYKRNEAA